MRTEWPSVQPKGAPNKVELFQWPGSLIIQSARQLATWTMILFNIVTHMFQCWAETQDRQAGDWIHFTLFPQLFLFSSAIGGMWRMLMTVHCWKVSTDDLRWCSVRSVLCVLLRLFIYLTSFVLPTQYIFPPFCVQQNVRAHFVNDSVINVSSVASLQKKKLIHYRWSES